MGFPRLWKPGEFGKNCNSSEILVDKLLLDLVIFNLLGTKIFLLQQPLEFHLVQAFNSIVESFSVMESILS